MARDKLISQKILKKVQDYIMFKMENNIKDNDEFSKLSEILPESLVRKIACRRVKDLLLKFPAFSKAEEDFLTEVAMNLVLRIYLPYDYIFYQGEEGEQMYFIIDGKVGLLEDDERRISKQIESGNYLGEFALFMPCKRNCSAIAMTYCLIHILNKEKLEKILDNFPIMKEQFTKDSKS